MKLDEMTEILTKRFGARLEGDVLAIPEGAEVTLFASLTGETLAVPRVTRIALTKDVVFPETARGERYAIATDDVRALKVDRIDTDKRDRSAGFGRG